MHRIWPGLPTVILALGLGLAAPADAEVRQVDGKLWTESSTAEKRAYMAGVANTLAVAKALATKAGNPYANPAVDQLDEAVDAGTLDQAIAKIDQWYAANPSRVGTPVLGVVWLTLVKR
jgi:hypothetical protein